MKIMLELKDIKKSYYIGDNKQNGFYYFKGKNQYNYGDYANFDLIIYDSDNFIFYYFEYDS